MPRKALLDTLEDDYHKMQAMFYGDMVAWDTITAEIKQFESDFNHKN